MRSPLASILLATTRRKRARPPSRYRHIARISPISVSCKPLLRVSMLSHVFSIRHRHFARRPSPPTGPPPPPRPPPRRTQQLLSLTPTIYTLSDIFEDRPTSDAEAPVAAPDSDSTSSLLPSSSLRTKAKILFSAPALYHSPASLSYALPPVTSSKHTEVACLGRSNVGKSSLVAALLGGGAGRGKGPLVRTSKRPGCTQTLNLYSLQVPALSFFFISLSSPFLRCPLPCLTPPLLSPRGDLPPSFCPSFPPSFAPSLIPSFPPSFPSSPRAILTSTWSICLATALRGRGGGSARHGWR